MSTASSKSHIEIIYEDDDVLVLNKPAGLSVHADGRTEQETLSDWIIENYPEIEGVGEPFVDKDENEISRPGIVHRLDKDTSGVIIVAKNQKSYEHLKDQFQNRKAKKKYLTLVYGNCVDNAGVIDRPIGKSKKDYRLRSAESNARGTLREAETHYRVAERFIGKGRDKSSLTLLEVEPRTGRMHQIRVHMQSYSHPVVGDRLYAPGKPSPKGLKRQALHASELTVKLPSGEEKTFEVPLSEDFQAALEGLRRS